jgi:hypothetical protein
VNDDNDLKLAQKKLITQQFYRCRDHTICYESKWQTSTVAGGGRRSVAVGRVSDLGIAFGVPKR